MVLCLYMRISLSQEIYEKYYWLTVMMCIKYLMVQKKAYIECVLKFLIYPPINSFMWIL